MNNIKQDRIARLIRINESHCRILSSVNGILFERDALEAQAASDAVFEVCTDEEILAISTPSLGSLFDEIDVALIRKELANV